MGKYLDSRWGAFTAAMIVGLALARCNDSPVAPSPPTSIGDAHDEGGAPVACFTTDPNPPEVTAQDPIVLDAGCSVNVESEESFHWDLGDGRTATGRKIETRYRRSGEYHVTLSVSAQEKTSETAMDVRVRQRPQACFHFRQVLENDPEPCTVDFDASCSVGTLKEYRWFFEGGPRPDLPLPDTNMTTSEPLITYSWGRDEECFNFRPFDRIVRLTVVDENGVSETHEELVQFWTPILRK